MTFYGEKTLTLMEKSLVTMMSFIIPARLESIDGEDYYF